MQLFNSKSITRLLALIMIVVLALGCLAGCSGSNGGKDDDDEKSSSSGDRVKYEWNGLIYYLGEDFKTDDGYNYAKHRTDDLTVVVSDDVTPGNVTDSASYAQHYADIIESNAESVSVKSKNSVYYTISDFGNSVIEAQGYYVNGDHCWMINVTTNKYDEHSSEILSIITSAKIDEDFEYTTGGTGSTGNTDNSGTSGTPSTGNTGNTGSTGSTDNSGISGTVALVEHEWDGLTYYLRDTYSTKLSSSSATHVSGDTVVIVVSGELQDPSMDAEAFAQLYVDTALASNFTSQRYFANGVYYSVTDWDDSTTEIRGFYAYNGYGWCIYGTTYDYDVDAANLITYVTSGVIDTSYQHTTSGGTTGSTTTNQPVTSNTITVYAYVPSTWGTPGLWAWQDGGDDAYDAWPGETMVWNGSFYTATAPNWIDHIVLNGDGGSIQTDDVPVDSGIDLWIVIHANGAYYSLFYSEPNSADFAAMGY